MKQKLTSPQLDLLDVRRRLVEMRSLHSDDPRVTAAINRLISKFAHLSEPTTQNEEKKLSNMIEETLRRVESPSSEICASKTHTRVADQVDRSARFCPISSS
jgi:hypothetical protein